MEMMYARVGQALQAVGDSTSHPTDYLLFLCPGKNKLTTGLLLKKCWLPAEFESKQSFKYYHLDTKNSFLPLIKNEFLVST